VPDAWEDALRGWYQEHVVVNKGRGLTRVGGVPAIASNELMMKALAFPDVSRISRADAMRLGVVARVIGWKSSLVGVTRARGYLLTPPKGRS
jgi:hypothetical protein